MNLQAPESNQQSQQAMFYILTRTIRELAKEKQIS